MLKAFCTQCEDLQAQDENDTEAEERFHLDESDESGDESSDKGKIASCLSDARKVNICTNVWTKKGMTSSYLGVTAHFFTHRDHR